MEREPAEPRKRNRLAAMLRDDRGAAAVSFILCFPLFLTIVAIVVQFALIANARLVVEHACHAAARAAETSLADGQPQNVHRAARMALAQISPEARGGAPAEAQAIADALRDSAGVSRAFANRYAYAMDATEVGWSGGDFESSSGQEIEVMVRYRFQLTVPVAGALLRNSYRDSVAGVDGRFYEIVSTRRVQTAPARKTSAFDDGTPRR